MVTSVFFFLEKSIFLEIYLLCFDAIYFELLIFYFMKFLH